jgi:uncharacterized protein (TIGR03435 family)
MATLYGILAFAAVLAAEPLSAQGTGPAKEFEVVSIRDAPELSPQDRMAVDPRTRVSRISPGLVRMPYESVARILQRAFGLARPQVIAPEWTESRHFSIAAKLPDGATRDDVPEMLRNMLSVRFHLAYHTEVRNTPVLVLSLAKGGIKAETAAVQSRRRGSPIDHGGMHYELATTFAGLADFLKEQTFSPVLDRTGLLNTYSFSFDFYLFGKLGEDGKPLEPPTDDFPADVARHYGEALAPLGLLLTPSKAALENVIIDHLDREPTEN